MVTGGGHTRACHARLSNHWLPRFLSRFWFADVTRHSRIPSALTKYGANLFRPVVASANQKAATTSTRYARPRRDYGTIFWVNLRRARLREASVRLATQEALLCPCWWKECTWFGALWGGVEKQSLHNLARKMNLRLSNSAPIVMHCDYIQVLENVRRIGMEMVNKWSIPTRCARRLGVYRYGCEGGHARRKRFRQLFNLDWDVGNVWIYHHFFPWK